MAKIFTFYVSVLNKKLHDRYPELSPHLSPSLFPRPLIIHRSNAIITGEFDCRPVWRPAARCLASLSAASPGSDKRNL